MVVLNDYPSVAMDCIYSRLALQKKGLIADKLQCEKSEIEPYVYMLITSVSNYMIFADDVFVTPQMKFAKRKFAESID